MCRSVQKGWKLADMEPAPRARGGCGRLVVRHRVAVPSGALRPDGPLEEPLQVRGVKSQGALTPGLRRRPEVGVDVAFMDVLGVDVTHDGEQPAEGDLDRLQPGGRVAL